MELSWTPRIFNGETHFKVTDIPDEEWSPSDVGNPDGSRRIDLEDRNSWKWDKSAMPVWETKDERKVLRNYGITDYSLLEMEVLKYEVGSFFKEHVDRTRFDKHAGTLLLIGFSSDAEGGDLIVSDQVQVQKTKDEECWFMTFIPLGSPHVVTHLLKGRRYVVKFAIKDSNIKEEKKIDKGKGRETTKEDKEIAQEKAATVYKRLIEAGHNPQYAGIKKRMAYNNHLRRIRGEPILLD